MSGTSPATPAIPLAATAAPSEPTWAKPSIGVYTLTLFVGCLALAAVTKNELMGSLIVGAVIAKFGTVVDYYFGSSSGSTKKTDLMAANPPPAPAVTDPAATVTRTTSTSQTVAPVVTPIPTPAPTPGPLTP